MSRLVGVVCGGTTGELWFSFVLIDSQLGKAQTGGCNPGRARALSRGCT